MSFLGHPQLPAPGYQTVGNSCFVQRPQQKRQPNEAWKKIFCQTGALVRLRLTLGSLFTESLNKNAQDKLN